MAFYFITGKLGNGKSLITVGRIRDKLRAGCMVATNIDINLVAMFGRTARNLCVIRVPDKPTVHDLEFIGNANASYDENRNGLLALDECGTWFNSRNWQDKTRQAVNNWMLHARKLGWDVALIVQDISIVDSQAREALSEHTVFCRRLDRLAVPVVGTLFKALTGFRLSLPRVHVAKVVYGMLPTDLLSDRWTYRGNDLFSCYDTKQAFLADYPHGVYCLLTPWHTHGRFQRPRDREFYMRMTKILWKRFKSPLAMAVGVLLGVTVAAAAAFGYAYREIDEQRSVLAQQIEALQKQPVKEEGAPVAEKPVQPGFLDGRSVTIIFNRSDGRTIDYVFRVSGAGSRVDMTPGELYRMGYIVRPVNQCLATIEGHGNAVTAFCADQPAEVAAVP